ncbi:MAG: hypothetical protein ACRD3F_05905 [Acidobacteriaceae bacterium]
MLSKPSRPPTRDADLKQYLHDALGLMPAIGRWEDVKRVPYYLQDAFEFRELTLLDRRILLAIERRENNPPAAALREQMSTLAAISDIPIAYVTSTLASYERKRLVEQKIPFIVPGNQLYLPELGIDLREYFRQRPDTLKPALSPSTQAMLITALLRTPWNSVWRPAEAAAKLGYTPMTISRAVRELAEAGMGEIHRERRMRSLHFSDRPGDIWQQAQSLLRSPIKRTEWAISMAPLHPSEAPIAGLSALAEATMLAEPRWPVRAVSSRKWLSAARGGLEGLPEAALGAYQWQIWAYDPNLGTPRRMVDPLSLTLSLKGESDERIQLALDDLKEQFPW